MIVSALVSRCRREFQDIPASTIVSRNGNGSINLFNTGKFPIVEGSYKVYVSGALKVEVTDYTIDLDNGDVTLTAAPGATSPVKVSMKTAFWRDANWVDAINKAIEDLNGKGFFNQVVRDQNIFSISANVQKYVVPSGIVDLYEILQSDTGTVSGNYAKIATNWSWQAAAGAVVLGQKPTRASKAAVSYLRELRTYTATSATLDVASGWIPLIQAKAGAIFYRSMAGRIAKQGSATIDQGHFSFTNLRAQANDLDKEYDDFAKRKKPTRPAKDIQWNIPAGGPA